MVLSAVETVNGQLGVFGNDIVRITLWGVWKSWWWCFINVSYFFQNRWNCHVRRVVEEEAGGNGRKPTTRFNSSTLCVSVRLNGKISRWFFPAKDKGISHLATVRGTRNSWIWHIERGLPCFHLCCARPCTVNLCLHPLHFSRCRLVTPLSENWPDVPPSLALELRFVT